MTSYQFISINYRGKSNDFQLWCRDENQKKHCLIITGFKSYFYVDENIVVPDNPAHLSTDIDCKSIFSGQVQKLVCTDPLSVGTWSQSFEKTYENDVRFVRRLLIDTNIKNGFTAPDGQKTVYWKDLKPTNFLITNLLCVTLDIEVETKWRFPDPKHAREMVSAVSVHDTNHKKYITLVVDEPRGGTRETRSDEHIVIFRKTERELFEQLKSYLEWTAGDVIRNWNVFFDLDYIRGRGKVIGVLMDDVIDSYSHFDQLQGYRKVFRKSSNQLKDVVVDEELAKPEDLVVDGRLLYMKDRESFIEYSMKDVRYCVDIDEKHRLTQYYWRFKTFCGLEDFSPTMYHSTKVDTLFLRTAQHVFNCVLPSKHYGENDDEDSYKGAVVLDPEPGMFYGIGVFDMSRFYPSIIMAYKLSPERNDGKGIFQAVITDLMEFRDLYDKQLKEIRSTLGTESEQYKSIKEQRQVVKDLLNSVYGYAGEKISRLYDREMAAKITSVARRVLLYLKDRIELDLGYKVKYGDTDSLCILVPFDKCLEVQEYANKILDEFCKQEGVESILKINFEKYYKSAMWVEAKGDKTRGAKKYYAANCLLNLGKNKIWFANDINRGVNEVKVGDKLIGFDEINKKFVPTTVREVFSRNVDEIYEISFEGINSESNKSVVPSRKIYVTSEHPFYVKNSYVKTSNLKVGDELFFITKSDKMQVQLQFDNNYKLKQEQARKKINLYAKTSKGRLTRSINSKNDWEREVYIVPDKITHDELVKDYLPKIVQFVHNGVRISNIKKLRYNNLHRSFPKYSKTVDKKLRVVNFHCEPHNNFFVNNVLTHNCIYDDGDVVDDIVIKGFDRGGGTSVIGRKVLRKVIEYSVRGRRDDIPPLIQETVRKIKSGEYTLNEIAINVGLSKEISGYKQNKLPVYVRGAVYANKFLDAEVRGGDKVKQIWVKRVPGHPPTNVISVLDENQVPKSTIVDYEQMIHSTIYLKIESILKVLKLNWYVCMGAKTLSSSF